MINTLLSNVRLILLLAFLATSGLSQSTRILSGVVVTPQFELVPNVELEIRTTVGALSATTDGEGRFSTSSGDSDFREPS